MEGLQKNGGLLVKKLQNGWDLCKHPLPFNFCVYYNGTYNDATDHSSPKN